MGWDLWCYRRSIKRFHYNLLILYFTILAEAIAEITGAPDVHIDEGSTLRLECKIMQVTENPSYVFW